MKRSLAVLVLSAAFAAWASVPAGATHSWGGYHWGRTQNPFTLKLGDNVSGDWDTHLSTASSDWTASKVLDTTVVSGGTRGRQCKPTEGRVEVCNARYGANGWLGLAQIWISGKHIVQGVAKMNDTYFETSTYNNPSAKLHVLCQEVGHTLGLDHQPAGTASCMNDRDRLFDPAAAHPNAHDYDQLDTIYGHLDPSSTVGTAAEVHVTVSMTSNGPFTILTWIFWAGGEASA